MRTIVLALLGASVSVSCHAMTSSQTPTQQTAQMVRAGAFSRYHTFSFDLPGQPTAGYDVNERSIEAEGRVRQAVVAALVRKGYAETSQGGDFLVRLSSGTHELIESKTDTGIEAPGEEAYVTIDLFDAANHTQVWHGVAISNAERLTIDVAQLQGTVLTAIAAVPAQMSSTSSVAAN
jgi:Domain of unknown function (DUF4136)